MNGTVTREQALAAFADTFTRGIAQRAAMTPREAAEAAYYPGHPLGTVEAIETKIRTRRMEAAQHDGQHATAA